MTSMFGNLPAHEKQAFFSILDEYFQSRPHLLGAQSGGDEQEAAAAINAYTPPIASSAPALTARRAGPPAPAARKPVSPMPSSAARSSGYTPSNVVSGKSIGSINTSSAGAAFGSLMKSNKESKNPITPGEALSGLHAVTSAANRLNLGQQAGQRRTPAPPPPPPAAEEADYLGQAEVIYEYKGTEADDLNVRKFEIISLTEKVDENWWRAETTDGRSGLVPSSYVKVI